MSRNHVFGDIIVKLVKVGIWQWAAVRLALRSRLRTLGSGLWALDEEQTRAKASRLIRAAELAPRTPMHVLPFTSSYARGLLKNNWPDSKS
jgi:hypothetical protein